MFFLPLVFTGLGSILKKISDAKKENNIFVVCLFDDKMEKPELVSFPHGLELHEAYI